MICSTRFYLLTFTCLIIPKLIRFAVMCSLDTTFRHGIPCGVSRTSLTFLARKVIPGGLLRTFSTDQLVLIPERSIRRAEGWSSCARCWSCYSSISGCGGVSDWLRIFAFSRINIVKSKLRTFDRIIICFAVASHCVGIPNLILSTPSTTSNIDVIERMFFRASLAT